MNANEIIWLYRMGMHETLRILEINDRKFRLLRNLAKMKYMEK